MLWQPGRRQDSFTLSHGKKRDEVFKRSFETFLTEFTSSLSSHFDVQSIDNPRLNKMGSNREVINVSSSTKALTLNRRYLTLMGIWPERIHDFLFIPNFVYLILHCTLTVMDMRNYSKNLGLILANLTELNVFVNTLVKLTICRMHKDTLIEFLTDIRNDFKVGSYRNKQEMQDFWGYNRLSYLFTLIAIPFKCASTSMYFLQTFVTNLRMGSMNSSFEYHLPYKTYTVIEINDPTTYALYGFYQMLILPALIFGCVGCDCFFITLALHITAQLSVLKRRVRGAFEDPNGCRCGMKKLINSHYRLIRLTDTLESVFNIGVLQQMIGTTFNLCCAGYYAIVYTANSQLTKLLPFSIFITVVLGILFIYCYAGECLMQESMDFGSEMYNYEWYNVSPSDLKYVYICMIRANRPLQLSSGKFFTLSIYTFTDILKTAVGYLSVLRTMMDID